MLKQCSKRSILMKQLRGQGLSNKQLNTVFDAIILSRLRYMLYQHGMNLYPMSLNDALMLSCIVCFHLVIVRSYILFGN